MDRLFTAIWPPAPALAELSAALRPIDGWPPEGWRPVPTRRWHLTLCFHGDADPGVLARRLDARLAGGAGPDGTGPGRAFGAPRLRLAGQVSFAGVIAAAVCTGSPADGDALAALVAAAGSDPGSHRPHVTVARTARRGDHPPRGGPLRGFTGSWWRPVEVCLVRSEQVSGAPRFSTLHRVPLGVGERVGEPHPPARPTDRVAGWETPGW